MNQKNITRVVYLALCGFLGACAPFGMHGPTEKAQKKDEYVAYAGPQQNWPQSDKHIEPIQICRNGIVISDEFPNRPYEILGTVHEEGDSLEKPASQAAAKVNGDAVLVVGDNAFRDAGIDVEPHWYKNKRMPDPNAPPPADR